MVGRTCNTTLVFMTTILDVIKNMEGASICFIMNSLPAVFGSYTAKSRSMDLFVKSMKSCRKSIRWRQPHKTELVIMRRLERTDCITTPTLNPISFRAASHNVEAVDRWVHKAWSQRWNQAGDCRQSKLFLTAPKEEVARDMKNLTRSEFGLVVQTITGHGWLNRHRALVGETVDPLCRLCCEEDEEPGHLFWDCPAIVTERKSYITGTGTSDWLVSDILRFLELDQVRDLYSLS